jgi:hypothetical protein
MPRRSLSLKTALVQAGVVAAGAFGVMRAINRRARARSDEATQPAATTRSTQIAAKPAGDTTLRPDHPSTAPEPRPEWRRVEHTALPRPTYWPAVLALGIVFLAWGLVTSLLISGVGLVLFVLALAGWIGDLRHGH